MYNISSTIRIVQQYENKNGWIIFDSESSREYNINYSVYLFIKHINEVEVNDEKMLFKIAEKFIYKSENIVKKLLEENIIKKENEKVYNKNILSKLRVKYPLTRLIIELTDACNLKCIHCYGNFGENKKCRYLSFEEIEQLKKAMDRLHTKSIALTGGEVFLNKDFEKIALFFLSNGFKLTIFTNGYSTEKVKSFLEKTKKYRFNMGISLDGNKNCHNYIRGSEKAYEKVMKTLNVLSSYENVEVTISTTVMRHNYKLLYDMTKEIKYKFPKMQHQFTIMMPTYGGDTESFEIKEFDNVYKFVPDAFLLPKIVETKHRCRGGVTGGALSSNGNIKICNAAPDLPQFIMGNIYEKELEEIWIRPNKETLKYRKEKVKQNECKKCKNNKKCSTKNCRLYAYYYKLNEDYASPINCYVTERGIL